MQTETDALPEALRERVERLVQASREPIRATTSTSAAIAELVARIEALELALREIAEAAGTHSPGGRSAGG
jgi:hypothetical protein